ncbi:MAG: thioredoxin [Propionibacterium sp.]|nr:MAG: thioredoxin [Propionibacterium sp.]
MAINEGTVGNFNKLLSTNKIVIVDYWADWCSPCKQLAPILDELAAEYNDDIDVVKIDTNSQPQLAAAHGVMSLPTLHFYSQGTMVRTVQGGQTKRQLTKAIESLL